MSTARKNYITEIDSRISGIPCLIGVTEFKQVKGSYSYSADSDMDYRGYTEVDFEVLDRRGRPAAWLERKLDSLGRTHIEDLIIEELCD